MCEAILLCFDHTSDVFNVSVLLVLDHLYIDGVELTVLVGYIASRDTFSTTFSCTLLPPTRLHATFHVEVGTPHADDGMHRIFFSLFVCTVMMNASRFVSIHCSTILLSNIIIINSFSSVPLFIFIFCF